MAIYPTSMPYDDIIINDQSIYSDNPTVVETPFIPSGPTLYQPFISERGYGDDNKLMYMSTALLNKYGNPNLKKYGLSLYLAKRFLEAGGTLLGMRVTAPGMKYAHSVLVADVKASSRIVEYSTVTNNIDGTVINRPYFIDSKGTKVIFDDIKITDPSDVSTIVDGNGNSIILSTKISASYNGIAVDLSVTDVETGKSFTLVKEGKTDADKEIFTISKLSYNPHIIYKLVNVTGISDIDSPSIDDIKNIIKTTYNINNLTPTNSSGEYPIALIVSRGAGEYANAFKFRITPDTATNTHNETNGVDAFCYKFIDSENNSKLDNPFSFSFDDDYSYNGTAMNIDDTFEKYSKDIKMEKLGGYDKLIENFENVTPSSDILFATDDESIYVDTINGIDLSNANGYSLSEGADVKSTFTWKNDPFAEALANAYGGDDSNIIDDMIYDQIKYPYQYLFCPSVDDKVVAAVHKLTQDRKGTRASYFVVGTNGSYPKTYTEARTARNSMTDDSWKEDMVVEWARVTDPYTGKKTYFPSVYFNAYAYPFHWLNRKGKPLAGPTHAVWNGFEIGSVMPRSSRDTEWIANHDARINTMIEDGIGNAVLYEQITSQKVTSALSEINNAQVLVDMVRIALRTANNNRWSDLGDDEISVYKNDVESNISAELKNCYDTMEVIAQRESENGAGANRVYCRINVKFKNILKGVTYDFYILAN